MNTKTPELQRRLTLFGAFLLSASMGYPQAAPASSSTSPASTETDDEVIQLSPFEVSAEENRGYTAATTLAGNRLNTELRDIGNAVTVITSQFLTDIAATNNETLLQYTVGTEVGNIQGNFAGVGDGSFLDESGRFTNPNQNTRVRGLAQADNTRDYFQTDIPWDGYAVDRVDLQRGPNSILFGQGSPAGIINTGTRQASFRNSNEVSVRIDDQYSMRTTLDINRVLLKDQLAVRIAAVRDDENFQQEPAYELDERLYGALRYEPGFLKKGSARTILKANFEAGNIDANRPRSLPPIDLITPWFYTGTYQGTWASNGSYRDANGNVVNVTKGSARTFRNLNRETFNPHQLQDDNTGRANHGQMRPGINGGPDAGRFNPAFNPWVGNFGQQYGGPNAFYATPGGVPDMWIWEIRSNRGISSAGVDDNGIGGFAFHRPGGIATMAQFARAAGLPYSSFGVYKNNNLTDSSVFDFYNNLIDGPNKSEWQNFKTYNISLAQTFMNDKFGFEYVRNHENYDNGQLALLSGERQAIYIDFMSVYSDGTPDGLNGEPHQNGTRNPNVGRPFISDSGQGGNNSYDSKRTSDRATVFFTHDFNRNRSDNVFTRLLGRHTLTGLWSEDEQEADRRSWSRYSVTNQSYYNLFELGSNPKFNNNEFSINRVVYLGPSLINNSTSAGANIPRPDALSTVPATTTMKFFDSTWANRPGVNPADPWINNYYPVGNANRNSFQSENPANYIGWINAPLEILDSESSAAARDKLTTSARKNLNKNEAKAFVWQAHLWDNAIVGTYGYRKDTPYAKEVSVTSNNTAAFMGYPDLSPSNYSLDQTANDGPKGRRVTTTSFSTVKSEAYSIVAHLDQLPGIGKLTEKLPVAVTLFYNDSSNFQPAANRRDVYGEPIPLPQGTTKDKGVLLETRDGKYSFKVNKYKTELTNASSGALGGAWFIGASQAWSAQWVNIFEYNLSGDTGNTANGPSAGRYTYSPAPGETQADADRREAAAIAAWRAWQKSVDPRFYSSWNLDVTGANLTKSVSYTSPAGFTVTEDSISEGWEYEFSAQPTRNWRITLNASKTTAVRKNIGGKNLADFIKAYETGLKTTAMGDLRIWWGGAGNETALFQWNNNIGSEYAARKLQEGTNVPELREWRFNVVSNYDFSEGRFKGFNVGTALRWQDDVVIGYAPVPVPNDPTSISFDLANPYRGPAETNIDLWVGYGRKLRNDIDWRIQLNVRNVGEGDYLIPVTTQPDGTAAGYRIAPRQAWTITNTFRF